jgi:hypothetical protein
MVYIYIYIYITSKVTQKVQTFWGNNTRAGVDAFPEK